MNFKKTAAAVLAAVTMFSYSAGYFRYTVPQMSIPKLLELIAKQK